MVPLSSDDVRFRLPPLSYYYDYHRAYRVPSGGDAGVVAGCYHVVTTCHPAHS